jgi:hypothetical protein
MKKVVTRMQRKTPSFFKKLRTIGLGIAALGTAIVAGPVALPAIIIKIAGYLAVTGGVVVAVSQTAVKNDE